MQNFLATKMKLRWRFIRLILNHSKNVQKKLVTADTTKNNIFLRISQRLHFHHPKSHSFPRLFFP